jgi:hypothetical protein
MHPADFDEQLTNGDVGDEGVLELGEFVGRAAAIQVTQGQAGEGG